MESIAAIRAGDVDYDQNHRPTIINWSH